MNKSEFYIAGDKYVSIEGYEDYYWVSEKGVIVNSKRRVIKPIEKDSGYMKVNLSKKGTRKEHRIHRLVAQAFIGDIKGKDVHHKDYDPKNNNVENLEILSKLENIIDERITREKRTRINSLARKISLKTSVSVRSCILILNYLHTEGGQRNDIAQ